MIYPSFQLLIKHLRHPGTGAESADTGILEGRPTCTFLITCMHLRHINNYMILHPVLSFPGYLLFISSITLISHIMVTDTLLILSDYSTKWVEASVLLVRVATSLMKVLCITHYLYSHVYIVRPALKISTDENGLPKLLSTCRSGTRSQESLRS